MTDINIMFKALKLACNLLVKFSKSSSFTVPNHFFKEMGGLSFLLRCKHIGLFLMIAAVLCHCKKINKDCKSNRNLLKNLYQLTSRLFTKRGELNLRPPNTNQSPDREEDEDYKLSRVCWCCLSVETKLLNQGLKSK